MNSKHYAIFGSFKENSVGDIAILVSELDLIFKVSPNHPRVTVLTSNDKAVRTMIEKFEWSQWVKIVDPIGPPKSNQIHEVIFFYLKHLAYFAIKLIQFLIGKSELDGKYKYRLLFNRKCIGNPDHLFIGGGNLIMDLYPAWPHMLHYVVENTIEKKIPYSFIGSGAGPISTEDGENLLSYCLESAEKIIVRDNNSKNLIKEKFGFHAYQQPDFVFSLPQVSIQNKRKPKFDIGINIAPIVGKHWNQSNTALHNTYENMLVEVIAKLIKEKNYRVLLFDTNYPHDSIYSNRIKKKLILLDKHFENNLTYADKKPSVRSVLNDISQCKILLTTRLHAGLLSLISGKPVLAFAYQEKVSSVFYDLGLASSVFALNELDPNDMLKKIDMCETNKEMYSLNQKKLAELNQENVEMMKKLLEG